MAATDASWPAAQARSTSRSAPPAVASMPYAMVAAQSASSIAASEAKSATGISGASSNTRKPSPCRSHTRQTSASRDWLAATKSSTRAMLSPLALTAGSACEAANTATTGRRKRGVALSCQRASQAACAARVPPGTGSETSAVAGPPHPLPDGIGGSSSISARMSLKGNGDGRSVMRRKASGQGKSLNCSWV
jgi:hypothetical protein